MLAASGGAEPQPLDVMPAPAHVSMAQGSLAAGRLPDVVFSGGTNRRLALEVARLRERWDRRVGESAPKSAFSLTVSCAALAADYPSGSEDESYRLSVAADGKVAVEAATDLGALHGLETLLQLLSHDERGWRLPAVSIEDAPRFRWRGLLIDVARHWQPAEVVRRNIDAMALVKLNVLHLHLTDDQGFRIESKTHPELQSKGSDGKFYTQEEMKGLITYAAERGIRVVPEFDIPGHTGSWVVSHPELASMPGNYSIIRTWGVFDPVLDPTNEATYALLTDFLGEMSALFPDHLLHIGGDENNGVQWSANPKIQAFIREHGLKDNPGLHAYFNRRIASILSAHGKRVVGWDEIESPDLPKDIVIDSWRGSDGIAAAVALGFDCIRANGYYIDLCHPASEHYLADPLPYPDTYSAAQRSHVLGGEATMWSEWVSPETIDSRIWPRTAAIAERLWSPADVRDVADMYRRLGSISLRLDETGTLHLRNREGMISHLVGGDAKTPLAQAVRTFVGLLEPVKGYKRFDLQKGSSQQMALTTVADAATPDSAPAREISSDIEKALFGGQSPDKEALTRISGVLSAWSEAARQVDAVDPALHPSVGDGLGLAQKLEAACKAAGTAIDALSSGRSLSAARTSACYAALDYAAVPDASAAELVFLPSLRLLVAAAAEPGPAGGPDWAHRVRSAAEPPKANAN